MDYLKRVPVSFNSKTVVGAFAGLGFFYTLNKTLAWAKQRKLTNTSQWDWSNEIVLVTGGSSGIGELVVRKLAERGIKVVSVDLRPPTSSFPSNVTFFELDVTSPDDIRKVAKSIRRDVGEPTVLINNAGVASLKTILDETDQEIRRTFDVNVVAHFFLIREFLPWMISQNHGHIITIASMASFVTVASNIDYCCSKAAALAFHEGLVQELKHRYNASNINVSIVHPMWIRTPMFEAVLKKGHFSDILLEPHDVADVIVAQVIGGRSGQLFLPGYYSIGSMLRGLPTWVQEFIRDMRANLFTSS
ncbi:putative short-chain dehydrogenases/reductase [Dactylonectria estremocensis]|uniref:Short-chain dehydrogenase/reductase 3 n=1 Tax=Dactylonectria estremocensis TaxID=1079267 RepID=A0A9P9E6Q3_9HYPO|nr:putative short-chain dehydrogenases/reductase [Dactylonectria estremocensis]